jgi:hypothetical protein
MELALTRSNDNVGAWFFLREKTWGYPHPGGFWQRVRNRMKTNELSFSLAQKSAQECGKEGDRSKYVGTFDDLNAGTWAKK